MAKEETKKLSVEEVDVERLKTLIKQELAGCTDVVHISTYANCIYLVTKASNCPEYLVQFTCWQNEVVLHNVIPLESIVNSRRLEELEKAANLMNVVKVEREGE